MSIFKNILFLQGYLTDPRDADDADGTSYARGYGNRIASEKALGRLGHGHAGQRDAVAETEELCTAGGCG
ncbi:hypothetical protein ACFQZQ_10245 [Lysobacter koreensis]|uniref:Uncharacterized protein n=1 Tax=Lysobacter koreensis TaxID=266122 RepID=A0ABW2YMR7_9GAMM